LTAEDRDSVVGRAFRDESGRAVATLIRVLGDFDAAEEAVQEAFVTALERWPRDGVPSNPGAWITRVARNRAIDRLRRDSTLRDKKAILAGLEALRPPVGEPELSEEGEAAAEIEDDRLRLIFTCCHPALAIEARVALTLRSLGGLETPEIARAFLVSESTMAQRLVRAKRKIAGAGIPYEVPRADRMPERLPGVLATLYLIFNEGYLGSSSDELVRVELSAEAIRLARVLASMLPDEPEVQALLALMLLTDARREARVGPDGVPVPLEEQDRALWDGERIVEGLALSERAAAAGPVGPYTVQARIAAVHATASGAEQDRLGADRPPLRMAGPPRARSRRRAQPGGGGGDERGTGARAGDDRGDRGPRRLRAAARRPRRPAAPSRTRPGGDRRLRVRPRALGQSGRAPLPRAADRRAQPTFSLTQAR
jgi:RNA polymerase sigma-70 factor (ECF subfamily)